MRRRTSVLPILVSALALGALVAAQTPQSSRPARDTPAQSQDRTAPPPPGGRISGRVLAADTGRPVNRARVLLSAPELPGGRGALTDGDGRFDFAELPQGRYGLTVSKSGFINLAYGQRRPLQPGTPIQLGDGQELRGVEFRLPRGSVIAGHVFDEAGDPLPGATVRVMNYRYAQGSRQLVPVGLAQTDDRGEYRVWGLNPGEYYVTAVARNFNFNQAGGPVGRGGRGGAPVPGVRGTANVGGSTPPPPDQSDAPELSGYAPTYYPGVESIAQARPVTVTLGGQLLDIDFGVLLVRTSRITGRVIASDGSAVSTGNVVLAPEGQQAGRQGPGTGFGGRIAWDGAFTIANVPPGRYVLRARGDDWDVPQFAVMPLTVSGGDMSGLSVVLVPGATIAGTVTFQRSQALNANPSDFRIAAPSADGPAVGPQQNARVDDQGRFTLQGVAVGSHWIRAQTPRGWVLKQVLADGRDVTDAPVDLRSGQRLTASVVFTDKLSEINGTIADERGTPITDYTLLVFPADSSLWAPQSRYIVTARPDQNGRFQMRGLPPGEYLLAAVDPTEPGQWFEPAFLDEQRGSAVRLTLGDGDIKTQNVQIPTAR